MASASAGGGSSRPSAYQWVLALEHSLSGVPHAFGGALALAYCAEPRATIDIDLNVFVPAERFPEVPARCDSWVWP